ncbi:MAG TPA: 23S rRNA (guanosine(2251)-2'-O)-methyltransferase RlmB [Baekduia sp.]|nr:23S rRNA (guanosine(2251)-2'-O)-methyltransferase RlmB [Baekduia sp.]
MSAKNAGRGGGRGPRGGRSKGGGDDEDARPRKPKPPRDRDRPKPRTPGRGKPVPRGAEATSGASAPPAHEPRRERDREHVETLYGRNPIFEALRAGRREIKRIWATSGAAKEPWLDGVLLEPADGDWLTQRCGSDAHQGLVADVGPYPYADPASLLTGSAPLIVALDEIQDPQNLGAIARSAEAAGASGIVIPNRRSAEITAAAAKASAGAVEHLKIAQVRNLADYLGEAKGAGCWVYGAAAKGRPYREPDYTGGVVLVMGAEGTGLRPRVRAMCDDVVSLPMRGRVDSLNVSAAAAVLLYGVIDARAAAR